jgi:hypothetical protein
MIRKNDPELSFVDAALVLIEREWKSHDDGNVLY